MEHEVKNELNILPKRCKEMATYPDLIETTGFISVCPERAHVVTDIDFNL